MTFEPSSRRGDFAIFDQGSTQRPLTYLDTAATSLKPRRVVESLAHFYNFESANVHRGAHFLSDRATERFEGVRDRVRKFINARSTEEIVFTSGTTDALNLVAYSYGRKHLQSGDEILLTEMEHHSNIVPWQMLAREIGAHVQWVRVDDSGELDLEDLRSKLNSRTKILAVTFGSNVIGTVNNILEITPLAHAVGAKVIVDAAQVVTFKNIDVQKLDCDFLAFSAHKMYGPFGVGVLYGKKDLLNSMPPYRGGGAMIERVTKEGVTFLASPQRFEAGTPNISGVIGLGAAIDYIEQIGRTNIERHEQSLLLALREGLQKFSRVRCLGESQSCVNLLGFTLVGVHSSDVGSILDQMGVAVRTGHMCAQPLVERFGHTSVMRVSFGVYNSMEDVDNFIKALKRAEEMLT